MAGPGVATIRFLSNEYDWGNRAFTGPSVSLMPNLRLSESGLPGSASHGNLIRACRPKQAQKIKTALKSQDADVNKRHGEQAADFSGMIFVVHVGIVSFRRYLFGVMIN
jgi:hypothetical protein